MICGCKPSEQITHYRAKKILPPEPEAVDGMLGAIISHGSQGWFFKLAGPVQAVSTQANAFHEFIKSVKFEEDEPRYQPPKDWHSIGRSGMRYESFEISSEGKKIELAVTTLPKPPGDEASFLLSNINRWRGQLGLRPIGPDDLAKSTETLELDGATATLVSLVGKLKPSNMAAPFAGGRDGQ
jgi:hypothetical protein